MYSVGVLLSLVFSATARIITAFHWIEKAKIK
jgi:hypothetical protein